MYPSDCGEPNKNAVRCHLCSALADLLFLVVFQGPGETEISWREFRQEYLEPKRVDRLVVVNKSLVRVILKQRTTTEAPVVFFTIGSVDSFERRLEFVSFGISPPPVF